MRPDSADPAVRALLRRHELGLDTAAETALFLSMLGLDQPPEGGAPIRLSSPDPGERRRPDRDR